MKFRSPVTTCIMSLLVLLIFCTASAFQAGNTALERGAYLFRENCIRCHGEDGTKGFLGAKNLQRSRLSDSAITLKIQKGKGFMPSFRKKFTAEDINAVIVYIKQLRKD